MPDKFPLLLKDGKHIWFNFNALQIIENSYRGIPETYSYIDR